MEEALLPKNPAPKRLLLAPPVGDEVQRQLWLAGPLVAGVR